MLQSHFEIRKSDLSQTRWHQTPLAELKPGEVLLGLDRFALTANNITYAALGDSFSYWAHFPSADGWGRLPVWGFANVVQSAHPEVTVGERLFGYFPLGSHAVLEPVQLRRDRLSDGSPARSGLASAYLSYRRVAPADAQQEALTALLQPLFLTSFLLADLLTAESGFAAQRLLITSASAKTALATAGLLARERPVGLKIVGLTSPRHLEFVRESGWFDEVLSYAQIETLDPLLPSVLFDFAGDAVVRSRLHNHLAEAMRHSALIGATHWQEMRAPEALPGALPTVFFAPARLRQRTQDWGAALLAERIEKAWDVALPGFMRFLKLRTLSSPAQIEASYRDLLAGDVDPRQGLIGEWIHPLRS